MYGWAGQRLKVYLGEGRIVKEELPEELRLNYLGGRGLNAKTLFDAVKPRVDPLGPDNVFMVSTGPLAGTLAPCSARWTVTAKSPLTFIFGDGNGGAAAGSGNENIARKHSCRGHVVGPGRGQLYPLETRSVG